MGHAEFLDRRGSIIYRKNPRFCLFGVGDHSFAPLENCNFRFL